MRIAVGSDERTSLTDSVLEELKRRDHEVVLYGALQEGDDPRWPRVAQRVAEQVASAQAQQGILFCWTGTGVSMVANKLPGARAALCDDVETARGARRWNDANILCMSLRRTAPEVAKEVLHAWFSTVELDETELENIEQVKQLDRQKTAV
ncbi:MAG: RpiB/LacA/LacB family sugar-phosphate isomerase [Dehalococcoidia bacterium]